MSERNDKADSGNEEEAQKSVARRLVDSDAPGSEFETREMPVVDDPDETKPDEPAEDSQNDPGETVNPMVVDPKRPGSNDDTSKINKKDIESGDDEFDSGVRKVSDSSEDEPEGFERADEELDDTGEAPTRAASKSSDPFDDLETREVPILKDEWKRRAAEVSESLGDTAQVAGEWEDDEGGDASLAASVAAASGEVPLPRDDEPTDIAGPVINNSRNAQEAWRKLRFEQRVGNFKALQAELVSQRNDYVPSMATAIGRPMVETLTGEYQPVLETLRTLDELVPQLLVDNHGASVPSTHLGIEASMRLVPYGVVLIANAARSPFAFPMALAIDALATGNSVLICGSETHPRINEMMRKLFRRAKFPDGLVQVLAGDTETLRAMIEARPDKVIYEGEGETAARVAMQCALNACEFHYVRPSKDTLVVLEDADLDRAILASLHGSFSGGGMLQGTIERIVVANPIYDEFRMKFIEAIREMNSHHAQLAHIKEAYNPRRAKLLVEDAIALGARVTYPAGEEPGRWIHWKAGVVEALSPKAKLSTEPFEGPGVALYRAEDAVKEVSKLLHVAPANNLSVLGMPTREMLAELDQLPVSRLSIGEPVNSGGGATGGNPLGPDMPRTISGPLSMLRSKITLKSDASHQRLAWYPYTDDKAYAMMDAMEAMYGVETGKRIKAALKLWLNSTKRRLIRGED